MKKKKMFYRYGDYPPPLCRMALAQLRDAAYVIGIFNGYT